MPSRLCRVRSAMLAFTLIIAAGGAQAAGRTAYPLTLQNCGAVVTFDKPPQRVVGLGQNSTETLLSLGLADRMVGSAIWVGPVLPGLAADNARVKRISDNYPSFEAVVGQDPDLIAAQFESSVGEVGSVGKRSQFTGLGIRTYIAPSDCAEKTNLAGGDGTRRQMFTMDQVYQEIAELAAIFDVGERGDALIASLKAREAAAIASVDGAAMKGVPVVFWFSSKEVKGDAYVGGKNGAPAYILSRLGARNVITTEQEWPLVSWESIAATGPSIIVIGQMDRRRFAADDWQVKLNFLETDPVVSQLDAVRKRNFVLMNAQDMNPTLRTIEGIEILAKGIRDAGLAR